MRPLPRVDDAARHTHEFLAEQARHSCTDCGQNLLMSPAIHEAGHSIHRRFGGGTVAWSKTGPVTEMHIIPHGGTELPADLLVTIDESDRAELAALVHDNADIGTGLIFRLLARQISTGELTGAAVAGFHVSRLLVDANRAAPGYQVPRRPYVGSAHLYEHYIKAHRRRLLAQDLAPWLRAVNQFLRRLGATGVAYHHHSYDLRSMSPRSWDLGVRPQRPPFQLVWKRPARSRRERAAPYRDGDVRGGGLAHAGQLRSVRDRIADYLASKYGAGSIAENIDYPLELPLTPFWGTRRADWATGVQHVMYDIRKDMLDCAQRVEAWVEAGPWRIPGP